MRRGVIYVVYGDPAHRCLQMSVSSLLKHEPRVDIHVVADHEVPGLGTTVAPNEDMGARSVKTQLNQYVPRHWQQALYLDVDTLIRKPLDRLWDPLNRGWDMVLCRDETASSVLRCRLKHRDETRYTIQSLGTHEVAQYAGGVIAWTPNGQTNKFWRVWHSEWLRFKRRDQGALTRTLAQVPLKVWSLEYQANAKHKEEAVEIWHRHGMARRAGTP